MPIFTIIYHDNSTQKKKAESKDDLIRDFCLNDPTAFQNDVKQIRWEEDNHCCIETISSGKIEKTANLSIK